MRRVVRQVKKERLTPARHGFDYFHGFLGDMMDDYYHHRRANRNYMRHNEKTIDLPLVFEGGKIPKQMAEKWLFTLWNERVRYNTVIPWTFMKLDPTG